MLLLLTRTRIRYGKYRQICLGEPLNDYNFVDDIQEIESALNRELLWQQLIRINTCARHFLHL